MILAASEAKAENAPKSGQRVANQTGAVLVAGMTHVSGTVKYNEARIYAPGAPVRSYDKEHRLPPFELVYAPGTSRTMFEAPGKVAGQMWGVAICKDLDFTEPARGMDGRTWGCCWRRHGIFA